MVKHFTSDELYQFLYENNYDIFHNNMNDLKSRIKYFTFDNGYWRNDIYVVKFIDNKIVGVLDYAYCENPTYQGHLHFISYISVDSDFRNHGIATELIEYFSTNIVRSDKKVLGCSGFTEDGFKYLIPILEKYIPNIEMERKVSFI